MSNKEAYEQKMDAEIEKYQAQIDQLKAEAKKVSADAEIQYNKDIEELEDKLSATQDKLKEIKSASQETWDELSNNAKDATKDIEARLRAAKDSLIN